MPSRISVAEILVAAALGIAGVFPPSAQALPPQRCNGVIQFRPCGQPIATGKRRTITAVPLSAALLGETPRYALPAPRTKSADGSYAEVISQTMSPMSSSLGQWRGTLRGNGTVYLRLLWYRNGLLSAARSMGVVKLIDKSTKFAFRSSFPNGSGWTWKVAAYATTTPS